MGRPKHLASKIPKFDTPQPSFAELCQLPSMDVLNIWPTSINPNNGSLQLVYRDETIQGAQIFVRIKGFQGEGD
jgi:hypothetical protein